jgi:MYXO-CTERM domain-containing protein
MIAWLAAAALARPVAAGLPEARLSGALAEALRDVEEPAQLAARQPRFAEGAHVVVEVEDYFRRDSLAAAGAVLEAEAPGLLQVWVPLATLGALATLPGVRHVREPAYATATATRSEGHAEVGTDRWNAAGWTGNGVSVAIVDVGFAGYEALAGSELPSALATDLSRGAPASSAHGTAVAEVIADVAPEAKMSLHSFATDVEFVAVLDSLLGTDVAVVNASIGFDNAWSADGTSAASRAVDALAAEGAIVVVAAGNENLRYRVGELRAVGDGLVLLGGHAATRLPAPGGRARVSLRWDEPFGASTTDLDLWVKNADDGSECGRSEAPQDGDDPPREAVDVSGCSEEVLVFIRAAASVDPAGITGWLYCPAGVDEVSRTSGLSVSVPGDASGAFTVGAWVAENDAPAAYSSRGPTDDGRQKPDVIAPSGVTTASWGVEAFEGSSAATPHAAGLAALWTEWQGEPGEPEAFKEWAHTNAREGGEPGPDSAWGWGALSAGPAPEPGCGCASGNPGGSPGLALLVAALYLGRRR